MNKQHETVQPNEQELALDGVEMSDEEGLAKVTPIRIKLRVIRVAIPSFVVH
jgi:hypothetical protein